MKQHDIWDAINRKKANIFYYVFVPVVAVFSVFNYTSGFKVIGILEAMLVLISLVTFLLQNKIKTVLLSHLSVAYISVLSFAFIFFSAVGDSAYIWVVGLPFFTSYLVGSRSSAYWSVGFLSLAVVTGVSLFILGHQLYWPWEQAPYIAMPYIVAVIFGASFARYLEKYIDDLKQAQEKSIQDTKALEESEARYRTILYSSMNAVGVHRDGYWIYANPACLKVLGAEKFQDIADVPVMDFVYPSHQVMVRERIEEMRLTQKTVPMVEETFLRLNGDPFPAEVSAAPIVFDGKQAFMVTIRDISELKRYEREQQNMQTQLEHAQRLESLGVLAGGIAHDFNNLLTAISGNAELLRGEISHIDKAKKYMNHIDDSCTHAADLCKQMLAYAGKGQYVIDVIALNELVDSIGALVRASVSREIKISMDLTEDLLMIEGDVSQLKQVLLNFIVNAADAIDESNGHIHVRTFNAHINQRQLNTIYNGTNMTEGEYVVLEVKDNGCGMSEALQKKIFDPFVTTKEAGTGLGLSAVLGIVRLHSGGLKLKSEEGRGTAFRVFLPASEKSDTTTVHIGTGELQGWQGSGFVLVVDDDSTVREVMLSFVQQMHFEVMLAEDGREGVELFRLHNHKIKVVIMDMTMPRLGGLDAMREMRKINPNIPIVMMSGYSETEVSVVDSGEQPSGFVQKPFRFKDVKKVLYQVMGNE